MVVLLVRFAISQMDVPTRQSYTMAVVDPDERSAAAGVTGVARSLGVATSPLIAGPLFLSAAFAGAPFVIAGGLKIVYDLLLYRRFQAVRPPEEQTGAQRVARLVPALRRSAPGPDDGDRSRPTARRAQMAAGSLATVAVLPVQVLAVPAVPPPVDASLQYAAGAGDRIEPELVAGGAAVDRDAA